MKRLMYFVMLLAVAVVALAACSDQNYDRDVIEEDYLYMTENEGDGLENDNVVLPWDESEMTLEAAAYWFAWVHAAWDADGGEMWGVPLHVPIVFVCDDTGIAVANRPNLRDGFVEQYVGDIRVYVGTRAPMPCPQIDFAHSGAGGKLI